MKTLFLSIAILLGSLPGCADNSALLNIVRRVTQQEATFVTQLRTRTPMLETYIQEVPPVSDAKASTPVVRDHYFLGRLDLSNGIRYTPLVARSDLLKTSWLKFFRSHSMMFGPEGFAQMIFIDKSGFAAESYSFEYAGREFLGDVRTLILDVTPRDPDSPGRFIGRIWVEDQTYQVVRFNGNYTHSTAEHMFFHFDSWRVCVAPGLWVPAVVYVEEAAGVKKASPLFSFKAQTRLWGYNTGAALRSDELARILVEMDTPAKDGEIGTDLSPLESQRAWEHQSEQNVLERLEKSGLLSPKGPVDQVLDTVINNLSATNGLTVEAHGRVLLTTPIETFTVGHTILISRGLLDVLPDENSLAMVLSDELAHIALGHKTNTQFAFRSMTMFSDEELIERFRFARTQQETAEAGKRAVEFLSKSPYASKLGNAGLFLRALSSRAPRFPNLIRPNIGNGLANGETILRMADLLARAPSLEEDKLEQIAALPLGSRVKLDPWTCETSLMKTRPVELLAAREKLLFEITPFTLFLTRAEGRLKASGE